MEVYKKPIISAGWNANGIVPALLGGAVAVVKGLSAATLLVAGVAMGLSKGDNRIDSTHTVTLTERKNFALE